MRQDSEQWPPGVWRYGCKSRGELEGLNERYKTAGREEEGGRRKERMKKHGRGVKARHGVGLMEEKWMKEVGNKGETWVRIRGGEMDERGSE